MTALAVVVSYSLSVRAQSGTERSAATVQDHERAASFVAQAKAALAAGDSAAALRGFRCAWDLAKTPEIAGNLAIIEASLGRHRDAAEHFQFALSHLPPSATTEQKQAVAAGLDTEKQRVVTLVVRGAPVGARLSVDGQIFGTAPYTDNLYVEVGPHEVRAEASGYESLTQTISSATIGTTIAVQLALRPLEVQPEATHPNQQSPRSPAPIMDPAAKPSPVVLIVGGGLTLVGAVVGTVYSLKASTAQDDAARLRAELPTGNACFGSSAPVEECTALGNANSAVIHDRNIATASFIVSGAAAAGTLVYWLWPRSGPARPVANAVVTPSYAAVQARWSW
ncbi:MAG TPA: PEGA domain-containing protein [Polyangiaceae bacterium]|nr:PEGA domain-containing protein [Polyangiaceae bacterium]